MDKISVFKQTSDDWSPSHQLSSWYKGFSNVMLVEVTFMPLSNGKWRVAAWGNDDCGLEKDLDSREVAWATFQSVIKLEYVNQHNLKSMGFVRG